MNQDPGYLDIIIVAGLPLILQLIGLFFVTLIDPYLNQRNKRIMLAIEGIIFILMIQNAASYVLDNFVSMPFFRTIVGIIGYWIRPLILVLFLMIVSGKKNTWNAWGLFAINIAVFTTTFFSGIAFYIDDNNVFHRGPLGYTSHFISIILLLCLAYYSLKTYRGRKIGEGLIPIATAVMIILAIIGEAGNSNPLVYDFLTISVVTGSIFFYIWLHLNFVRAHEESLFAEQRIQIMMSQIHPHFLYNTLSTIQALCRTDPEKAEIVTERFGTYLRQNLDSLNETNLIPIEREIEHTKVYAEIEEVRFPKIKVTFNINDTDFSVPALSIQPLVENAIRHGVRGESEGRVDISTRQTPDGHEIIVTDNGRGFDVDKMEELGDAHIGLRNVRERIEKMCEGTLKIVSDVNDGTTISIMIP